MRMSRTDHPIIEAGNHKVIGADRRVNSYQAARARFLFRHGTLYDYMPSLINAMKSFHVRRDCSMIAAQFALFLPRSAFTENYNVTGSLWRPSMITVHSATRLIVALCVIVIPAWSTSFAGIQEQVHPAPCGQPPLLERPKPIQLALPIQPKPARTESVKIKKSKHGKLAKLRFCRGLTISHRKEILGTPIKPGMTEREREALLRKRLQEIFQEALREAALKPMSDSWLQY